MIDLPIAEAVLPRYLRHAGDDCAERLPLPSLPSEADYGPLLHVSPACVPLQLARFSDVWPGLRVSAVEEYLNLPHVEVVSDVGPLTEPDAVPLVLPSVDSG